MSGMKQKSYIARNPALLKKGTPFIEVKLNYPLKRLFQRSFIYVALLIGAVSMIAPFLWMLSTSLKNPNDVLAFDKVWWKEWLPMSFVWQNYVKVWQMKTVPFAMFYLNSLFVSICITVGQVATSAMAAYAFARLSFPGRDKLFFGYLATMMIPGTVTMIPVFILLRHLGWIDTYKALILPGVFSAYGTFMLRQFFLTLPKDLEDAAKIDGCNYFRIFWHIIIPLSKPALATLTTFTFMGFWGSYMWPLIIIQSEGLRTLPIGLASFVGRYSAEYSLWMAASVIALVPVLLLFMFNQRYFQEGIKMSGIKG